MKWKKRSVRNSRLGQMRREVYPSSARDGRLCVACLVLAFGGMLSAMAQSFSITSCTLTNGALQIAFPGQADSYYLLQAAPSLSVTSQPVSALLGSSGSLWFGHSVSQASAMFFRVARLPLTATNDIIGDGIPDGFKLQHGLPVFGPSQANVTPLGDTRTWLQIYAAQTNLAALSVAYFPAASYSVLVGSSNVTVPVSFTKPFTGQLTYQLSGTAIPSLLGVTGDYIQPTGSVACNNSTSTSIVITLVPEQDIEVNRAIVIAISAPPLTNQTYAITTNSSVTTVHILQSTEGVFIGSLAITNGPLLGAQSVKMALRPGSGGNTVAAFDVTGNAFLGNMFSVPVAVGPNGFQLNGALFSNVVTNTPWGRSLNVNLSFGLTQTNGAVFSTPVTITIGGLTASGVSYSGSGRLTLCRSQ